MPPARNGSQQRSDGWKKVNREIGNINKPLLNNSRPGAFIRHLTDVRQAVFSRFNNLFSFLRKAGSNRQPNFVLSIKLSPREEQIGHAVCFRLAQAALRSSTIIYKSPFLFTDTKQGCGHYPGSFGTKAIIAQRHRRIAIF